MADKKFNVDSWLKDFLGEQVTVDKLDHRIFESISQSTGDPTQAEHLDEVSLARSKKKFLRGVWMHNLRARKKLILASLSAAASLAMVIMVSQSILDRKTSDFSVDPSSSKSSAIFAYSQTSKNDFEAYLNLDNARLTADKLTRILQSLEIEFVKDKISARFVVRFSVNDSDLSPFNLAARDLGLQLDHPGNWTVIFEET